MLGLERAVEGTDDSTVHGRVLRNVALARRAGSRPRILVARLHAELELAHVHGDEYQLRVRTFRIGSDHGAIEVGGRLGSSGQAAHRFQEAVSDRSPLSFAGLRILP